MRVGALLPWFRNMHVVDLFPAACMRMPDCVLQGHMYRPNVVRVGSDTAPLSQRAKDVWVDGMIQRYLDMSERECADNIQRFTAQVQQLSREIVTLQKSICKMKNQVAHCILPMS